jgi:glycosyltransferase involved in cell wall biosynthesis
VASDRTVLALPAGAKPDILWFGPLFEYTGYADEARNFVLGLRARGVPLRAASANDPSMAFLRQVEPAELQALRKAEQQKISNFPIVVEHVPGHSCKRTLGASYHVVRTMFESDSLPGTWAPLLNTMDEVWVPSAFNVETFRRGGVTVPLHVVPGGVDSDVFRPGLAPLPIEGLRGTVFLYVFEWSLRKGWDVLLTAWARTFSSEDDVTLLLRTHVFDDTEGTQPGINEWIDTFLSRLGTSRAKVAPIRVLTDPVSASEMPRLYATASAYVHPSRGEGWGRPIMEAMSSGLPAIATGWSGNMAFMTADNSLPIESVLAEVPEDTDGPWLQGQRWAEPSAEHLSQLMRGVVDDPDRARAIGARARADVVKHWTWANAVGVAERRLAELRGGFLRAPQAGAGDIPVRWVGDQFAHHSLSNVNREICVRLAQQRGLALEVFSRERRHDIDPRNASLRALASRSGPVLTKQAAVEVRHQWPPDWSPPAGGCWVAVQPWEFGGIPDDWVRAIRQGVDEVWCYSTYVRDCYVLSGVPRERVHVVPIGVDSVLFNPDGP